MAPPLTTFPNVAVTGFVPENSVKNRKDELDLCLVNSDPNECNQNLSKYIKYISEQDLDQGSSYHKLSVLAMKLICLNLFIRNYHLCIGKILALMTLFTDLQKQKSPCQDDSVKEFICIVLFLILKFKNLEGEDDEYSEFNRTIDTKELFDSLKSFRLITVVANFVVTHVEDSETSFVLLKFCGDIIFEYLFHVELLSDGEFHNLVTRTNLISTLIGDLLRNKSFHDYDINDLEWEDEDKLIAYEEFKLLLLINEQYLMKSYSCPTVRNQVFDGLMCQDTNEPSDSVNHKISGFMNLLVYHINREESQIIKILILKFLYLIFTSSYTSKLYYLNDLKILMDIFIRELDDVDYLDAKFAENRILVITYLKVLYPMMMFSQLNDLKEGYRVSDVINMLLNIILNISASGDSLPSLKQISELASRCLSVNCLKKKKKILGNEQASSSSSSLSSIPGPGHLEKASSTDSIASSFTRVASVRTSTRNDYHLHTTKHNISTSKLDLVEENNHNIFQSFDEMNIGSEVLKLERRQSNILDLPHEYLKVDLKSKLSNKAMKKAAPPPPPHHKHFQTPPPQSTLMPPIIERSARSLSPSSVPTASRVPPPPPPPRRRR